MKKLIPVLFLLLALAFTVKAQEFPLEEIPSQEVEEPPVEDVPSEPPPVEEGPSPTQEPLPKLLIINEVMRGSEINPEKDCFIELYNPTDEEVMLTGWQIQGVTSGGQWIELVSDDIHAVQPHSYFVISHYVNSSSSALSVRPQVNKSSILIPAGDISIGLRDGEGNLQDVAFIPADFLAEANTFRSYERLQPFSDGHLPESWSLATARIHLKDIAANTFATPFFANSLYGVPEDENESPEESDMPVVLINEVLPNPKKKDNENEFIELFNASTEVIDLFGWELDDESAAAEDDDVSYFFTDESRDYLLPPGGFLTLYRPETNITLEDFGDGVMLFDAEGNEVDSFFFAPDLAGRSWGRNPEDLDEWLSFNHPTPDASNVEMNHPPVAMIGVQGDTAYMHINVTGEESVDPDGDHLTYLWTFEEGAISSEENPLSYTYILAGEKTITLTVTDEYGLSSTTSIPFVAFERSGGGGGGSQPLKFYPDLHLINEFMVNPEGSDVDGEWIELYNSTSGPVDLGGWYLDDDDGASRPFRIPDGVILPRKGYVVFYGYDLKLSFKNKEDTVRLLDPNKEEKQTVDYIEARENQSHALSVEDSFLWTALPTPGYANTFPPPPKTYPMGAVRFESVLPNPAGEDGKNEKITLKNMTDEPVDLMGFMLEDKSGKQIIFDSFLLAPHQSIVIDSEIFKLSLNNSDEFLVLKDPSGNQMDRIAWKTSAADQWLMNANALSDGLRGTVERVKDGDTFTLRWGENLLTVRLIGVDTPETVHPFKAVEFFGKQASDHLKNLLTGREVTLNFDANKLDKYGRIVAYVYLGDRLVNEEILRSGYGYAYIRFPFRMKEAFVEVERVAKELGLGLWADAAVAKFAEDTQNLPQGTECEKNGTGAEPIEECEFEEELILLEEEILEEEPAEDEKPVCLSDQLKIESFLPNPQKGEAVEYIRLINKSAETVCLNSWSLDDILEKGSKSFLIKNGSMQAGAMRTFRKEETRLALNNSNDCVNLIDPDGKAVDQICYKKTHKNEVFTHLGGDWKPKPRKATVKKTSSAKTPSLDRRDPAEYQWELVTDTFAGVIEKWNEEEQIFVMRLEDGARVSVSYAGSAVDIESAKILMDIEGPLEAGVRAAPKVGAAGEENMLVALRPLAGAQMMVDESRASLPWRDVVLIVFFLAGGLYFKFKRAK